MTSIAEPLWLSLRVAIAATLLTLVVGLPLAFAMSRRWRWLRGKSVIEGVIMMPLVLPPTVVGYLIIVTLGARGWVGRWLAEWSGYSIMFRFEGAVLAAAVVALPMFYMPAKAAFATVEREMEDMARSMGASRLQTIWHVSIPLARRGLASGLLLSFARALGEFGATIMVFGWQPRRITLPISIYAHYEQGELASATPAVVALSLVSLGLIMAYNASSASRQE